MSLDVGSITRRRSGDPLADSGSDSDDSSDTTDSDPAPDPEPDDSGGSDVGSVTRTRSGDPTGSSDGSDDSDSTPSSSITRARSGDKNAPDRVSAPAAKQNAPSGTDPGDRTRTVTREDAGGSISGTTSSQSVGPIDEDLVGTGDGSAGTPDPAPDPEPDTGNGGIPDPGPRVVGGSDPPEAVQDGPGGGGSAVGDFPIGNLPGRGRGRGRGPPAFVTTGGDSSPAEESKQDQKQGDEGAVLGLDPATAAIGGVAGLGALGAAASALGVI